MALEMHARSAPRTATSFVREHHRYDRMLAGFEASMLDVASIAPGAAVLDVGAGAGTTSLRAGRRAGPTGRVLGTEADAAAIDLARVRARGMPWVRFRRADAASEPFEPGRFDVALSRFGTVQFRDPAAGFANVRRALRRGGLLAFVCARLGGPHAWSARPFGVLRSVLPPLPWIEREDAVSPPSEPGELRHVLRRAGFSSVELVGMDQRVFLGHDVDDALEFFFETDGRALGNALDEDALAEVTLRLRAALRPWLRDGEGVWAPASAWLAVAHA